MADPFWDALRDVDVHLRGSMRRGTHMDPESGRNPIEMNR